MSWLCRYVPRVFIFACIFLFGGAALPAEEGTLRASKPATKAEVIKTIDGQLAAFRAGDISRAYTFAAVDLQAQIPAAAFARMVEKNYPEIWANTRAEFGIVRDDAERATVLVHIYSAHGDAAYDYTLHRESGAWRIIGVLRHNPDGTDRI